MKKAADWIADMIDTALTNYNGRQIVLWGKYSVSDEIRRILKKKHDITNVIYVDGDSDLQDKKKVNSPNILGGMEQLFKMQVFIRQ